MDWNARTDTITDTRTLSIEGLARYWWGAPEHIWTARSGVRVVSSVARNDGGGWRGFRAYLAYYWFSVGRSK